jgi:hypothetical protein
MIEVCVKLGCAAILTLLACAAATTAVGNEAGPAYVVLGPAKGVVYRPPGAKPKVAVLLMHRTMDFLHHPACTQLSRRGLLVLCMNSRFENNEAQVRFEDLALDVRSGVEFLRHYPGIKTVLLWGHSGGAPIMSFYEAVAENGSGFCRDPHKLSQCEGSELKNLPHADGLILGDGHPGNPTMVMRGLDPAVGVDSGGRLKIDSSLDALDVRNGYNPQGPSHYSAEFRRQFFTAQAARMQQLIADALARRADIVAGRARYPDDDIFLIPGGGPPTGGVTGAVHLYLLDPSIPQVLTTLRPERLLRNDGSVVTTTVRSVVKADPESARLSRTFRYGTKQFTLTSFLSANAVRATDSVEAVDECTSNNSTLCAVPRIHIPVLIAGMGASILVRDAERFYEVSGSTDKDLIYVEGADHWYRPCADCGATPEAYANATRNFFDYVKGWIDTRY